MKNFLFTLSACALCATLAQAAPAKTAAKAKAAPVKVAAKAPAKTPAKVAAKVAAKPVVAPAAKKPATTATAKLAQATPGLMKPEEMPGFFPDVPRDHWAFAAVQRLAAAGIMNGYPATPAQAATAPALAAKLEDVKVAAVAETKPEAAPAAPADKQGE